MNTCFAIFFNQIARDLLKFCILGGRDCFFFTGLGHNDLSSSNIKLRLSRRWLGWKRRFPAAVDWEDDGFTFQGWILLDVFPIPCRFGVRKMCLGGQKERRTQNELMFPKIWIARECWNIKGGEMWWQGLWESKFLISSSFCGMARMALDVLVWYHISWPLAIRKKRKNGETRNIYSNLNFLAWGQQGCLTSSTPHDIGLSHAPPAKILAEN